MSSEYFAVLAALQRIKSEGWLNVDEISKVLDYIDNERTKRNL